VLAGQPGQQGQPARATSQGSQPGQPARAASQGSQPGQPASQAHQPGQPGQPARPSGQAHQPATSQASPDQPGHIGRRNARTSRSRSRREMRGGTSFSEIRPHNRRKRRPPTQRHAAVHVPQRRPAEGWRQGGRAPEGNLASLPRTAEQYAERLPLRARCEDRGHLQAALRTAITDCCRWRLHSSPVARVAR
jgi:hypothetical protein